ncbi:putative rho-associated protein kinase [Plasmopara halstedii]
MDSRNGRTNTMCGTDTYLPPEMVGRYPDGHGLSVDLWQFGCILFELRAGYPPFYLPQSSQKSTHKRILYQSVRYPNNMSSELKSLLVALLVKRQEDRLGYSSGVAEVKRHKFFKGIDWDQVLKRQLTPPLLPGPSGENLVGNFDPHFTDQPHTLYAPDEIASCFERDFTGFDYVRPPNASVNSSLTPLVLNLSTSSRTSTTKDMIESTDNTMSRISGNEQQSTCEDCNPEVDYDTGV